MLEPIEISKHKHNFNRDSVFELRVTWKPVIGKINNKCTLKMSSHGSGIAYNFIAHVRFGAFYPHSPSSTATLIYPKAKNTSFLYNF